jgi:hypothetical protein
MSHKRVYAKSRGCASRCAEAAPRRLAAVLPILLLTAALQNLAFARVLDDADLARVSRIKASFTEVVTDVSQSSQRTDLSSGDSECIKSTLRALMQISEELGPYEYLITIEGEMADFGDDSTLRGIVRFAVINALKILDNERRRMGDLSEQCARFPLSAGKTKQALQFIDGTSEILKSVRPRL